MSPECWGFWLLGLSSYQFPCFNLETSLWDHSDSHGLSQSNKSIPVYILLVLLIWETLTREGPGMWFYWWNAYTGCRKARVWTVALHKLYIHDVGRRIRSSRLSLTTQWGHRLAKPLRSQERNSEEDWAGRKMDQGCLNDNLVEDEFRAKAWNTLEKSRSVGHQASQYHFLLACIAKD